MTVSLLTSPVLFATYLQSKQYAGFGVAGVFALASILSISYFESDDNGLDIDIGWVAENTIYILTVLYYNTIVLASVIVGIAAMAAFGPTFALAAAVLYPILDFEAVEYGVPTSITGIWALAVMAILRISKLADSVSWRELRPKADFSPWARVRFR
jgi:hypothetical protein